MTNERGPVKVLVHPASDSSEAIPVLLYLVA
jgi:hypothetical protein